MRRETAEALATMLHDAIPPASPEGKIEVQLLEGTGPEDFGVSITTTNVLRDDFAASVLAHSFAIVGLLRARHLF